MTLTSRLSRKFSAQISFFLLEESFEMPRKRRNISSTLTCRKKRLVLQKRLVDKGHPWAFVFSERESVSKAAFSISSLS